MSTTAAAALFSKKIRQIVGFHYIQKKKEDWLLSRKIREMFSIMKAQCGKYYKTRSRFLGKNQHFFRQINVFTKEVTKELISRIFFQRDRILPTFPHCAFTSVEKYCKTRSR